MVADSRSTIFWYSSLRNQASYPQHSQRRQPNTRELIREPTGTHGAFCLTQYSHFELLELQTQSWAGAPSSNFATRRTHLIQIWRKAAVRAPGGVGRVIVAEIVLQDPSAQHKLSPARQRVSLTYSFVWIVYILNDLLV